MQVLIVDDDKWVALSAALVIEEQGWQVRSAHCVPRGLEQIRQERPDVILLDLMMPGMCGIEMLEILQEDPDTATIPVVILTAWEYREARQQALERGARSFLLKPFRSQALVEELKRQVADPEPSTA